MTYFYVAFFIACFLFSFLINALFLRFAHTLGIRDNRETVIRWASTSKPALGGISFYIVFLISLAAYSMFFQSQEVMWNKKIVGLLGTATLAFMMGLADDAYNTKPLLKLSVQILCGIILCYSGIHIGIFPNMALNYILTVLWVVGIMNSVNMLDNMDAITTVVSISIFSTAAMLILLSGGYENIHFLMLLGLVGALSGFLIFNWSPSKLYMGDTGSQVIGLLLAAIGIMYFWNDFSPMSTNVSVSKQVLLVATAFILPLTDTSVVVINRLAKRSSPFVGGKDHTTHHLFYRGITEKKIALLFSGISCVSAFIIWYLQTSAGAWAWKQFSLFALFPAAVFAFLFSVTRLKKNTEVKPSANGSHASSAFPELHAEKNLS